MTENIFDALLKPFNKKLTNIIYRFLGKSILNSIILLLCIILTGAYIHLITKYFDESTSEFAKTEAISACTYTCKKYDEYHGGSMYCFYTLTYNQSIDSLSVISYPYFKESSPDGTTTYYAAKNTLIYNHEQNNNTYTICVEFPTVRKKNVLPGIIFRIKELHENTYVITYYMYEDNNFFQLNNKDAIKLINFMAPK